MFRRKLEVACLWSNTKYIVHAKKLCVIATLRTWHREVRSSKLDNVPDTLRTQSAGRIGSSRALLGLKVSELFFLFPQGSDILLPSLRDCVRSALLSAPSASEMPYQGHANKSPVLPTNKSCC